METIEQIKIDEGGYQAEVYKCSEGKLTWLYGRNIEDRPITESEWEDLSIGLGGGYTQKDWAGLLFARECEDLNDYYYAVCDEYQNCPKCVKNIIINMGYNMGIGSFTPAKWPKFFKAIKEGDWKQAAVEGRDSKWFHQVGKRSVRLMNSLENVKQ